MLLKPEGFRRLEGPTSQVKSRANLSDQRSINARSRQKRGISAKHKRLPSARALDGGRGF